jgi:hypothetical protein
MSYLVYVEHNAQNHQFSLWYRDMSAASRHCQKGRRLFLRNGSRQHRSPRLVKGNRKEKENKKARIEAVATMMEIGYNIKDGALFGDEQAVSLGAMCLLI